MKNTARLVKTIREQGVSLSISGDHIEVAFLKENVDEGVLELIRDNKPEILQYLQSLSIVHDHINIPPVPLADSYALSSAQRRLWVLSQFEEASIAYNLPLQMELKEGYDIEAFKNAVYAVVERHEILRTVFRTNEAGDVRQWVQPLEELNFDIPCLDFRQSDNPKEEVEAYIAKDTYMAFDLEKGPLFRAALLQLADDHFVFCYNLHHIISDAWSVGIIQKDVFAYYEAFRQEEQAALTALPIQYKDYASWQTQQLEEGAFDVHRDFWLQQLSGDLPRLELPAKEVRPKLMTYKGQSLQTFLPKAGVQS
ncbi:MAG: condensation domain-containing protein, partial [Bacteroidota bacterium]